MYKNSILYVSDERSLQANLLDDYKKNFDLYIANDGIEALNIYHKKHPNIILTEIKVPLLNGLEFVSKIREKDDKTPIVILSKDICTGSLLCAVELNITKYLISPISKQDIIKAIAKCVSKLEVEDCIIPLTQEYTYNVDKKLIYHKEILLPMSLSESRFLELLIKNKDRVVSYHEIEYFVWEERYMSDAALRSLVYSVRNIFKNKEIIENISKIGYRINIMSEK